MEPGPDTRHKENVVSRPATPLKPEQRRQLKSLSVGLGSGHAQWVPMGQAESRGPAATPSPGTGLRQEPCRVQTNLGSPSPRLGLALKDSTSRLTNSSFRQQSNLHPLGDLPKGRVRECAVRQSNLSIRETSVAKCGSRASPHVWSEPQKSFWPRVTGRGSPPPRRPLPRSPSIPRRSQLPATDTPCPDFRPTAGHAPLDGHTRPGSRCGCGLGNWIARLTGEPLTLDDLAVPARTQARAPSQAAISQLLASVRHLEHEAARLGCRLSQQEPWTSDGQAPPAGAQLSQSGLAYWDERKKRPRSLKGTSDWPEMPGVQADLRYPQAGSKPASLETALEMPTGQLLDPEQGSFLSPKNKARHTVSLESDTACWQLLSRCFRAWQHLAWRRRAAAAALALGHRQLLRRGLQALRWTLRLRDAQLKVACRRHTQALLARSFQKWKNLTLQQKPGQPHIQAGLGPPPSGRGQGKGPSRRKPVVDPTQRSSPGSLREEARAQLIPPCSRSRPDRGAERAQVLQALQQLAVFLLWCRQKEQARQERGGPGRGLLGHTEDSEDGEAPPGLVLSCCGRSLDGPTAPSAPESLALQVLWGLAAISEKRDGVPAPPGRPPGRAPEAVPETMGGDEAAPDLRWGEGDPAVPLPAEGGEHGPPQLRLWKGHSPWPGEGGPGPGAAPGARPRLLAEGRRETGPPPGTAAMEEAAFPAPASHGIQRQVLRHTLRVWRLRVWDSGNPSGSARTTSAPEPLGSVPGGEASLGCSSLGKASRVPVLLETLRLSFLWAAGQRQQRRCLLLWRGRAQRSRLAAKWHQQALQRRTLLGWSHWATAHRARRELAARWAWDRSCRATLGIWRQRLEQWQEAEQWARERGQRLVRDALCHWHACWHRQQFLQGQYQRWVQVHVQGLRRAAFRGWQQVAARRRHTVARSEQLLLQSHFQAWRGLARRARTLQAQQQAFQDGLRRWALGAAFAMWREGRVATARAREQRVARASIAHWRSHVQGRRADKQQRRAQAQQGFIAWREALGHYCQARQQTEERAQAQTQVALCWTLWVRESRLHQLSQAHAARKLSARVLEAWARSAAQGRVQRVAIAQFQQAGLRVLLQTHWAQWRTALLRVWLEPRVEEASTAHPRPKAHLRHQPGLAGKGHLLVLMDAAAPWKTRSCRLQATGPMLPDPTQHYSLGGQRKWRETSWARSDRAPPLCPDIQLWLQRPGSASWTQGWPPTAPGEDRTSETSALKAQGQVDKRQLGKKYWQHWRLEALLHRLQGAQQARCLAATWQCWVDAQGTEELARTLLRQWHLRRAWRTWRQRVVQLRVARRLHQQDDGWVLSQAFEKWHQSRAARGPRRGATSSPRPAEQGGHQESRQQAASCPSPCV